jgi:predicted GNAT family N-acyltransferase
VPEEFSNRKIKNFDGFNAKMNGQRITEFPVILIGQLGKNEIYSGSIKGFEIMQYCLNTLLEGQIRLGGRIILIECRNIPFLIKFYEQFGFSKIEREYKGDELIQLVRIIKEDELIEADMKE